LIVNKKSIKANIIPNLLRSSIKNNSISILSNAVNKNIYKQKELEQNAGILRKKPEETGLNQSQLIASNFEDWNMAEQKLNKIKRKIEKDK
jgi:hypothetical protein